MNLKECYTEFGGDYDSALSRLMTEGLVKKFLLKFTQDTSYDLLINSLSDGNNEEAFRAAHTIKGICQNLSLDLLFSSVNLLTDELRDGKGNYSPELLEKVKQDYKKTISAIGVLDA